MRTLKSDEDAIFTGLEAEGPFKGKPTLFISGEPPMPQLHGLYVSGDHGLYLGAGSNIHKPLSIAALELLLDLNCQHFKRITIQCTDPELAPLYFRTIKDYYNAHNCARPLVEWIVPIIFDNYTMSREPIEIFEQDLRNEFLSVHFYFKVYVPDKLLLLYRLRGFNGDLYLHDSTLTQDEFTTDKILWRSSC